MTDYPPGKFSTLLVGHQWVSAWSLASLNSAQANRTTVNASFQNLEEMLQTASTTTLPEQKGKTAEDIQEAFRQGAAHARSVAEKNGVKATSYQNAYDSVTELRNELTGIANDGNKRIDDIQNSKDSIEIKLAEIVGVVSDCQRQANQSAAKYGANIIEAGQNILNAEGADQSFHEFARARGTDVAQLFSQPDRKAVEEQVARLLEKPGQTTSIGPAGETAAGLDAAQLTGVGPADKLPVGSDPASAATLTAGPMVPGSVAGGGGGLGASSGSGGAPGPVAAGPAVPGSVASGGGGLGASSGAGGAPAPVAPGPAAPGSLLNVGSNFGTAPVGPTAPAAPVAPPPPLSTPAVAAPQLPATALPAVPPTSGLSPGLAALNPTNLAPGLNSEIPAGTPALSGASALAGTSALAPPALPSQPLQALPPQLPPPSAPTFPAAGT
ncbi:MAG: hypothetical protein ACRDTV_20215, partial [Mycobacterium sp.]